MNSGGRRLPPSLALSTRDPAAAKVNLVWLRAPAQLSPKRTMIGSFDVFSKAGLQDFYVACPNPVELFSEEKDLSKTGSFVRFGLEVRGFQEIEGLFGPKVNGVEVTEDHRGQVLIAIRI